MFLSEFHNFEDPTTQIPYLVLKPTSGNLRIQKCIQACIDLYSEQLTQCTMTDLSESSIADTPQEVILLSFSSIYVLPQFISAPAIKLTYTNSTLQLRSTLPTKECYFSDEMVKISWGNRTIYLGEKQGVTTKTQY